MKISYLSNSAIPSRTANSVHVMKMCQAFCKNGHQVTLYARHGDIHADPASHYGIEAGFQILFSPYSTIPGINHFFYSLSINKKMSSAVKQDIIYGRHIYSLYAARNLKSFLIYEAHATPANQIQHLLETKLFDLSNFYRLVVISNALRNEYLRIHSGLNPERVIVAPDAADPIKLNQNDMRSFSWPGRTNTLQVGYIGHLYPGKGMEVISHLAEQMPDMDFHVIGGTESDIKYWKGLTCGENLYLHGFIPHGQHSIYFGHFDVMLAPYQQHVTTAGGRGNIAAWMSPLKLFEYMSAQKAIICSDLPVLREILEHRTNALLVNPLDISAWKEALLSIRDEPQLKQTLALNAHNRFLQSHTWSMRARNVLEGIQDVVS